LREDQPHGGDDRHRRRRQGARARQRDPERPLTAGEERAMTTTATKTPRARRAAHAAGLLLVLAVLALPAMAGPAKSVGEIRSPPLPEFKIPRPERVVLPNGMVVMLLEDHELPLVDAIALVHTGSRLEPAEKAGLASLVGRMLRSGGTTRMKSDQLDDFL